MIVFTPDHFILVVPQFQLQSIVNSHVLDGISCGEARTQFLDILHQVRFKEQLPRDDDARMVLCEHGGDIAPMLQSELGRVISQPSRSG